MSTILIVEDDQDIRELLRDILEEEIKCRVFGVSDGDEALFLLNEIVPHLFLLDYRLPGNINGIELIYSIRDVEIFKKTPIILMSACLSFEPPTMQDVSFMRKPFELDIFLRLVQERICI
jgi:DNA-binding response OmpR family regulator